MSLTGPALWVVALATVTAFSGCFGGDPASPAVDDASNKGLQLPPGVSIHFANGLAADPDSLANFSYLLAPDTIPTGLAQYLNHKAFEPTLGVAKDGALFMSAYEDGVGDVLRSKDKGATWEKVTPALAGVAFPPQSNDPYVHVDVDTGRVFNSDLQALMCSTLSYSDDEGKTWTSNPVGCGHPVGVHDHQTVFTGKPKVLPTVGYPNLVYYCVNRVVDSACAVSQNGGLSFGPLRPLVYSGIEPTGNCILGPIASGLHAHGTTGPDGTVYLGRGQCGKPMVAVSEDDGLTWRVTQLSTDKTMVGMGHEVATAVDEAGNAYAFWIGKDYKPYLAASKDKGKTWSKPIDVAPPGINVTYFPTVAAGAAGRVAVAYYGTDKGSKYENAQGDWNGYLSVLVDALADQPVILTTTVTGHPLAKGECGGSRCNGVGDFIDVVIDAEGRPWAAMVDVAGEGERSGGFAGTLATGPALRGELKPLTAIASAPTTET